MKKLLFALLFLCLAGSKNLWSQSGTDYDTREFTLKIINKRGKPLSGIVVHAIPSGQVGITDHQGRYIFPAIGVHEHMVLYLPKQGETTVAVNGLDSMLVVPRVRQTEYFDPHTLQKIDIGYGEISRKAATTPVSGLNVPEIVKSSGAKDLIDVLRGRVAGLDISPSGEAKIRGTSSFLLSSEPLVVIDGVAHGTLRDANGVLNIHDIQSVSVLKEGSIYGNRGANGVILITTKI